MPPLHDAMCLGTTMAEPAITMAGLPGAANLVPANQSKGDTHPFPQTRLPRGKQMVLEHPPFPLKAELENALYFGL